MRRQTLFLLFMILFSLPLTVLAQGTKTVKGTVVDQNNEPIIGATVVVKGSTIGAATDLDGNYVLNGVPEDATLVFNYLGMLPQEISAAGQSVINVKLREDAQLLEEVVVIGYGSAKAKDLTAPIDVVKEKELINVPTSSPMAALQGKVPGVNIINSGTPGEGPKVTIRGMGSFGDTSPLYVVDGMFYDKHQLPEQFRHSGHDHLERRIRICHLRCTRRQRCCNHHHQERKPQPGCQDYL